MLHTPTPWECSDEHVYAYHNDIDELICRLDGRAQDAAFFSDVPGRVEANARFIVTAANCHEDLLAALKYLVSDKQPKTLAWLTVHNPLALKLARAALKKAEER